MTTTSIRQQHGQEATLLFFSVRNLFCAKSLLCEISSVLPSTPKNNVRFLMPLVTWTVAIVLSVGTQPWTVRVGVAVAHEAREACQRSGASVFHTVEFCVTKVSIF